ncbi:glycosyltransferase [Halorubrum sp. BV1]|uniref:glycosyltransferase n=1 Tax=Halorubrum sp. BV1 TaxID=1498500 RepID=UPI001E42EDB4|nr:glycosyltransferase [Halorubrum sp. BV1]
MNAAQVVPYVTYPPRMGGDHRTHGLMKEFPELSDSVIRYCQGGTPAMYRSLDLRRHVTIADGYEERRHLHPIHEFPKAPMLLGYPNLFASTSLRLASDGLDTILNDADVVVVREPWQLPYVLDHAKPDAPVVYSSHNVETERFGDIDQPMCADRVAKRVDTLERRAVEETDAVICTGNRDADVYRDRYDPGGPMIVAPNGAYEDDVREHRPDSDGARRVRRKYDIADDATVSLFMGSNYRPNVEAAEAVVDIARNMTERDADFEFLILGDVGSALDDRHLPQNVTTTGYVEEDFESHFDAADVALNPMVSGGGTNIKLIEYFARSLPVISTPFGVRGIEVRDHEHVVVAERETTADEIEELGTDTDRRKRLGNAARLLTEEQYTWEASSRTVRSRLHELFGPF